MPSGRQEALTTLLEEVGAELRARRDPEHLFTAAIVGAVGAVAWGVATIATLAPENPIPWWRHPAIIGALACLVMTLAIWIKVLREHKLYIELRAEQIRLAGLLATESALSQEELPTGLRLGVHTGAGHKYSGFVIWASAGAAAIFCLSVWFVQCTHHG